MPRIKLPLPKRIDFQTTLELRIYDMNYGGHMGNDNVLSLAHEARVRFLESLSIKERDFYGCSLLMADSAIVYKNEAFYGDILVVKMYVSELYSHGFELFYLIQNQKNDIEVARVKTGLACYNHLQKKLVRLPIQFYEKFS